MKIAIYLRKIFVCRSAIKHALIEYKSGAIERSLRSKFTVNIGELRDGSRCKIPDLSLSGRSSEKCGRFTILNLSCRRLRQGPWVAIRDYTVIFASFIPTQQAM